MTHAQRLRSVSEIWHHTSPSHAALLAGADALDRVAAVERELAEARAETARLKAKVETVRAISTKLSEYDSKVVEAAGYWLQEALEDEEK